MEIRKWKNLRGDTLVVPKSEVQFCRQSRGSVYEIRDHLTTALDADYTTPEQYEQFDLQAISVIKLINGYLRATKQRQLQSATRK
jgi:four helix bundle protein